MTEQEKKNIYNAIQNLYNMDFTTWQEVLAMMYNLVADVEQKFEKLETKFTLLLGKEVTEAIKKMHESGELAKIINVEIFRDLNTKIDEIKVSILDTLNTEITKVDKEIEKVNKELNDKAKKRQIYYLSDYGKMNDLTYDNTPAFKQALKDLKKTGGKLIIDVGVWEFKTPCIIDDWLFGCEIVGMSRGIINKQTNENAIKGNFGTILNYSGSGCMFTFNGKMNHCKIENLYGLLQDGNEFMRFNYTFHKGIIKDISVLGGIGCLDFNTGTYVRIENFGYGSSDPNALYGIRIGKSETRYTTEFFYINNSSIDFGNLSNANCLDVYRLEGGLYVTLTDLCNTNGTGFRFENLLGASSNYFVIRDVNFTRTQIGIELFANTGNIGGVFVDNVRYGLKCTDINERIVKCYANSGKSVMINHKNAYVRTYSSLMPTYVAELSKMDWQSVFEINAGNTLAGGFNSPIKLDSDISRIYDYRIEYKGTKTLTLSEMTPTGTGASWKDYKIDIATLYPFYYMTPIVMVNFNYSFTNGVIKTEVVDGVLSVYLRIGNDVQNDTIKMNYVILN